MKEINDIIKAYNQLDTGQHKVAMATVIHVEGSSYRRSGARMLVQDNGIWTGGISGGCLEGDALKKAQHCMLQKDVKTVRYDTTNNDEKQIGVGLGCNGIIDVLLSPIEHNDDHNPIKILASCVNDRHVNCLVSVIHSELNSLQAGRMYKYGDKKTSLPTYEMVGFPDALTIDIKSALSAKKSTVKAYDKLSVFIEILKPTINVVLFGYQYDIYPLLKIGNELGWNMSVACKQAKMTKTMQSLSKQLHFDRSNIEYDDHTAFILMAHDYKTDKNNLLMALQSNVPYIGMLGPVKRKNKALDELHTLGHSFSAEQLNRLYNPVGLDIGAATPEEIALAILAEIRTHFSSKNGASLRQKAGTIHERMT